MKLHIYLDDWLLNPGTYQEALEQTSWLKSLCRRLGLVINLEKSDLIPSQVAMYLGIELDTLVGLARPSHKRVTNWLSIAEGFTAHQSPPAVQWTPSFSRETSALWSTTHSSHSMAIETPLEPVGGEILKTDSNRPSVPPGHPMVDQQGQFRKGSPNRTMDVEYYLYTDSSSQGLGCPLARINCIWHLVPGPSPATHMAWPKSFQPESGECKGCAHVRQHVCGCLPEISGGTKSLQMSDLATDICQWAEKRGMTLVHRHLPGHLNVLADHLSRRGEILRTEWSLNQTIADRIFRAWGRPFLDLFALGKNMKLARYISPIREETAWKVDNLVQNWDGLYAYAYPLTSLIRACLNKVRTESIEIILIAPGWPNQEWFPTCIVIRCRTGL